MRMLQALQQHSLLHHFMSSFIITHLSGQPVLLHAVRDIKPVRVDGLYSHVLSLVLALIHSLGPARSNECLIRYIIDFWTVGRPRQRFSKVFGRYPQHLLAGVLVRSWGVACFVLHQASEFCFYPQRLRRQFYVMPAIWIICSCCRIAQVTRVTDTASEGRLVKLCESIVQHQQVAKYKNQSARDGHERQDGHGLATSLPPCHPFADRMLRLLRQPSELKAYTSKTSPRKRPACSACCFPVQQYRMAVCSGSCCRNGSPCCPNAGHASARIMTKYGTFILWTHRTCNCWSGPCKQMLASMCKQRISTDLH